MVFMRKPSILRIVALGLVILGSGGVTVHSANGVTILGGVVKKYWWAPISITVVAEGTSPLSTPTVFRNGNPLVITRVRAYPQSSVTHFNFTIWVMDASGGLRAGDKIEIDVTNADGATGVYDTQPCQNFFGKSVVCYPGAQR